MKPILEIQNISKTFQIHHEKQAYLSIRDSLTSIFKKSNSSDEVFYALKDVSFDVFPGDSIGIIGRNGAGKSTLLKILSKITPPTAGKIISRGRIASLLEVGTGFHPELTGSENVFLNGSILGMKRAEIQKNFDAIIDFSGVEKFLDTPLKHYSSGMQLRLAFAVAAFLENEILIIDEVLAVGDAEFQKKCLGKMESISKNEGRTLLFVSHQLGMISLLCEKAIILNKGSIDMQGKTNLAINHYNEIISKDNLAYQINHEPTHKDIFIKSAFMINSSNRISTNFSYNEDFKLGIKFKIKNETKHCILGIHLKDMMGRNVFTTQIELDKCKIEMKSGNEYLATIKFPNHLLTPNQYSILGAIHIPNIRIIDRVDDMCVFSLLETGSSLALYEGADSGCVFANCDWEIKAEQ